MSEKVLYEQEIVCFYSEKKTYRSAILYDHSEHFNDSPVNRIRIESNVKTHQFLLNFRVFVKFSIFVVSAFESNSSGRWTK